VLANQKRKHRGAKSKKFLFLVSLSGLVINVIILTLLHTPLYSCVFPPPPSIPPCNPRSAESCSGTWEIRQILRMYGSGVWRGSKSPVPGARRSLSQFPNTDDATSERTCSLIEFIEVQRNRNAKARALIANRLCSE